MCFVVIKCFTSFCFKALNMQMRTFFVGSIKAQKQHGGGKMFKKRQNSTTKRWMCSLLCRQVLHPNSVMELNAAFKRNCRSSNDINGSMPGQNVKLEVSSYAWSRRVRGTKRCNDALVVGFKGSRIQSLTKPKMRSHPWGPCRAK